MRIFLTGATGYLGSAIAARLQEDGHDILGLARTREAAALLHSRNIHPVPGSLDDLDVLTSAARDADAVVQAAFQLGSDVDLSVKAERRSVEALLAGLRGTNKPLLFTSGAAVLGDTGTRVFTEDTSIAPHPFRGRYETEQVVLQERGVRGIVLRPPNVYGATNGKGLLSLLSAVGDSLGAVPFAKGTGDHLWTFVHLDDLSDLFALALMRSPHGQLFHAGAQSGLRTQSIAEAVSAASGRERRTVELEIDALRKVFPIAALADYWTTNNQSSKSKAETNLNWRPRHLDMLGEIAKPQTAA